MHCMPIAHFVHVSSTRLRYDDCTNGHTACVCALGMHATCASSTWHVLHARRTHACMFLAHWHVGSALRRREGPYTNDHASLRLHVGHACDLRIKHVTCTACMSHNTCMVRPHGMRYDRVHVHAALFNAVHPGLCTSKYACTVCA